MQISPSDISLYGRRIQLHLSTELNDVLSIRISQFVIVIICSLLISGIIGAVGLSMLGGSARVEAVQYASLQVESGTIYVVSAETGNRMRLSQGDLVLISRGDRVFAHMGRVLITHFDGSTQVVAGSNFVFVVPAHPAEEEPASRLPAWLQRFFGSMKSPRYYMSAASVLG
jgi:hypothetical protein